MSNPSISTSSPLHKTNTVDSFNADPFFNNDQPLPSNQGYYNTTQSSPLYYGGRKEPIGTGYKQREIIGVGTETTLGFNSFIFGFLFGIVLILIIFIILYLLRGLFFANVPIDYPTCANTDYYNDPAVALARTELNPRDILYVQDDTLFYKRVPSTRTCTPGPDQTIPITYPQYCLFERSSSDSSNNINDEPPEEGICNVNLGVGRTSGPAPHNTQASYEVDMWHTNVSATENCRPTSGAELGRPLARWDPFP